MRSEEEIQDKLDEILSKIEEERGSNHDNFTIRSTLEWVLDLEDDL